MYVFIFCQGMLTPIYFSFQMDSVSLIKQSWSMSIILIIVSSRCMENFNNIDLSERIQSFIISSVQFSHSVVLNSATPWTSACQASLSITNFWSLLKLMSIELVTPSNHLILCHPLLLLPSIFPSIRVFSNGSVLCIRWPTYWPKFWNFIFLGPWILPEAGVHSYIRWSILAGHILCLKIASEQRDNSNCGIQLADKFGLHNR